MHPRSNLIIQTFIDSDSKGFLFTSSTFRLGSHILRELRIYFNTHISITSFLYLFTDQEILLLSSLDFSSLAKHLSKHQSVFPILLVNIVHLIVGIVSMLLILTSSPSHNIF